MVDAWLIIVAIVIAGVTFVGCVYFLAFFSSPDDNNQAWLPKIIVIFSLFVSCCSVLLLPFDVANIASGTTLSLEVLWQIVYMSIAGMVVIVIPFAIYYYEAQDPEKGIGQQWVSAFLYEFVTLGSATLVIGLMYSFLGIAEIPYTLYVSTPTTTANGYLDALTGIAFSGACSICGPTRQRLNINVSLVIYIIAMLSFTGWVLFIFFGGTGLFALPLDLINGWRTRPQPMTAAAFAKEKIAIRERASKLLESGSALTDAQRKGAISRKTRKMFNAFKASVFLLEEDFHRLMIAYKERGGSVIKQMLLLIAGVLGMVISICWIIHICIYNILSQIDSPYTQPFLNNMFIELDNAFSLFGTLAYGIFAFYLLFCVIKGNTKLGMRFLFISIHPMKVNDTLMNSFLFNTALILLCSVTVTQFCASSFNLYARFTAVDSLFRTYVTNLKGIRYVWPVYLYCLLGVSALALLLLIIFPKDSSKDKEIDMGLVMLQNQAKASEETRTRNRNRV